MGHLRQGALEILAERLGSRARRGFPLGATTTYRVGGVAFLSVEAQDRDALLALREDIALVSSETGEEIPILVVGKGSNLLVADEGFMGLAVHLGSSFDYLGVSGTIVECGAATGLPVAARRTVAAGLTGFEWAVGVPGSVGGGVAMNAGGHGSDMRAVVRACWVVDLASPFGEARETRLPAASLEFGFRHSAITAGMVVTRAELELEPGERAKSEEMISAIVRWRREHQPGGSNAGSVFMNPPGERAGRLIDEAGCKGLRVGSAQVSEKHANFIQADSPGRSRDVLELMGIVRDRVFEVSGIWLEPEVRLVGMEMAGAAPAWEASLPRKPGGASGEAALASNEAEAIARAPMPGRSGADDRGTAG